MYRAPTPAFPSGVKSSGDGRFVSAIRHHDVPPGGGGSAASTKNSCELNAMYRSPFPPLPRS